MLDAMGKTGIKSKPPALPPPHTERADSTPMRQPHVSGTKRLGCATNMRLEGQLRYGPTGPELKGHRGIYLGDLESMKGLRRIRE